MITICIVSPYFATSADHWNTTLLPRIVWSSLDCSDSTHALVWLAKVGNFQAREDDSGFVTAGSN